MSEEKVVKRSTGTRSPEFNLETSLKMLESVSKALGNGPYDRLSIGNALGHAVLSGTVTIKIGALTHFGLLDRAGGGAYRLSSLGQSILKPTDQRERQRSIVAAAKHPNLYRDLFAQFKNSALPALFSNVLIRQFGVAEKGAEDVSKTFRETAEYAGLLRNGVLNEELEPVFENVAVTEGEPQVADSSKHRAKGQEAQHAAEKSNTEQRRYLIPLQQRNAGVLELPVLITKQDIQIIKRWLDLMQDVLTEESPPSVKG